MMELLHLGFNQDNELFACGTSTGFRVFNCDPFHEQFRREFNNGGIGIVELLFRCNILAVVGGGTNPRFPPTKVMIWDDDQGRCIAELSFRSQVRAVRLRRDRIVVAQEQRISVYNFADLRLLSTIETVSNPHGLMALSSHPDSTVLACPGLHTGKVRIELCDRSQTRFISAHTTQIARMVLSLDGKILATASERGTLIRVWNATDGTKLQELRRGSDQALITSIALSRGCEWLAVSSDKGTVHVFSLSEGLRQASEDPSRGVNGGGSSSGGGGDAPRNTSSVLSMVSNFVPVPNYFNSEWSFAQFKLQEENFINVGFGPQGNTILIATFGGSFYKVSFDPVKGGTCVQESYCAFFNSQATPA